MRNIFDQYNQPENRLTHALVSSLAADSALLRKFVRWVTGDSVPRSQRLEVLEQRLPGEEEASDEAEAERRGLPDAWIHSGDTWALILESKIQARLEKSQLDRHRRTAERRGFTSIHLVAFVPQRPRRPVPENVRIIAWTELYSWMNRDGTTEWARRLTEYMEVLERKLVEEDYLKEGTITVFAGIPFGKDYPYHYGEAKRLLRLALNELRTSKSLQRELGMNPRGEGRPAITGREGTSVWDFLPFAQAKGAANFTEFPHLTLSIKQEEMFVAVTVPNGIRGQFRHNLLGVNKERFIDVLQDVQHRIETALGRVEAAKPWLDIIQRRYPTQKGQPIADARLQFDLRTAFGGSKSTRPPVKKQPQWMEAVYQVLTKKHSNVQLAVGAVFPYERCPVVHTPEILNHVASVWLACKPLIRKALG